MINSIRAAAAIAILIFGFALGFALPSAVVGQEFNDAQRQEMGAIIREYLIENPEVLQEAVEALERKTQMAQEHAAQEAVAANAAELYRSDDDLVAGNPDGDVTMVEFFDYNCGYCKRAMGDVLKLLEADDDLRLVLKEWPILSEGSKAGARAALASRQQGKYWEFHLALMRERQVDETTALAVAERLGLDVEQLKADMESPEVAAVIERNMRLAEELGLRGTPAFFVADKPFPGAVGHGPLAQAIEQVRRDGGCDIC